MIVIKQTIKAYTGSEFSFSSTSGSTKTDFANGVYTVSYTGNKSTATNAGEQIVMTLTPDSNHQWGSGSSVRFGRTYTFTVLRAGVAVPTVKVDTSSGAVISAGGNQDVTYDGNAHGFYISSTANLQTPVYSNGSTLTNAGTTTLTLTPDSNHCWDNSGETDGKSYTLTVTRAHVTVPTAYMYYGNTNAELSVEAGESKSRQYENAAYTFSSSNSAKTAFANNAAYTVSYAGSVSSVTHLARKLLTPC